MRFRGKLGDRMNTRLVTACITLLTALLLLNGCGSYTFRGTVLEPPNDATDFTLTDQSGQPFRLSEQRGKIVLLYFGFTSCPDVCPMELASLARMRRELGDDAERVRVAMITVDPDRDTQERMRQYVTAFDPTFIGLHGTQAELDPILKAYGVMATRRDIPNSAMEYTMDHSAFVYVIDAEGRWRVLFAQGSKTEDITSDVRYLVRAAKG